jgi:phosphonopyruvate decarboxylase
VLARVIDATPLTGTVVIATTGYTGRELYALTDRANHFYMVGSMGCASAFGLGLALARPDLHVVIVDGDGAALMRMGNFATLGYYRPPNLSHLLLDNEAHDSTGGQTTVSAGVDFASIAAACGYASAQRAGSLDAISQFFGRQTGAGPGFMHVKIATGTLSDLPRPAITPPAVLARLRQHLEGTA